MGAVVNAQWPAPAPAGEWRSYASDLRNLHYSPLAQITAANFSALDVAWRFKTDSLGPRPEFELEGTPLMVNGVRYTTAGTRRAVVALDAKTGCRIAPFGKDGIVDLKDYVVFGKGQQIDREAGQIGLHATPAVTKDGVVMIGAAMLEGGTPTTHNNTKGLVRGFDGRTGRRLWTFNTIPRPGEFGNDNTCLDESWAVNGNAARSAPRVF
jgi:quinoprotein glucose dehydrogenase